MDINLPLTLGFSIGSVLVTLGITYGVVKTEIAALKNRIYAMEQASESAMNGQGGRLEKEIQSIKSESIHEIKAHEKESESEYKRLSNTVVRLEERIKCLTENVREKFDYLSRKVEKA